MTDNITQLFRKYDSKTPFFSLNGKTMVGRVVGVYDGDTMTAVTSVFGEYFKFQVRLLGIDTCEMKSKNERAKNLAQQAKARVIQRLVDGSGLQEHDSNNKTFFDDHIILVKLECGEFDKYGRLLANVYPYKAGEGEESVHFSDESISTTLLNEHLAYSYEGKTKLTEDEQLQLLSK